MEYNSPRMIRRPFRASTIFWGAIQGFRLPVKERETPPLATIRCPVSPQASRCGDRGSEWLAAQYGEFHFRVLLWITLWKTTKAPKGENDKGLGARI